MHLFLPAALASIAIMVVIAFGVESAVSEGRDMVVGLWFLCSFPFLIIDLDFSGVGASLGGVESDLDSYPLQCEFES